MADNTPTTGEKTGAQPAMMPKGLYGPFPCAPGESSINTPATLIYPPMFGGSGAAGQGFAPFEPPMPGTLEHFRRMKHTPTIAIGLSVPTARTIANEWSYKKRDKDVPDDHVEMLKRWFKPKRPQIIRDGLAALWAGYSTFEKVYTLVSPASLGLDGGDKWFLPELKPLRVEYTNFLTDNAMKQIVGLRNSPPYGDGTVDLGLDKSFWYTFGGESGDPYGKSLLENLREVWSEADQVRKKISRYINKVSGVLCTIHYPDGVSKDADGVDTPNFKLAKTLAAAAAEGRSLIFQNRFASFIADPANIKPSDLDKALAAAGKAEWVVSFLDPGGTDHSGGFKELLQYYDVLMVRGLLQPERSLLESQGSGSRADSMTHGELGVLFPEVLINDFVLNFNKHVIDDILEINVGPDARGSIYAEPDPISDDEYDAKLKTLHAMLQNPDSSAAVGERIDVDQLADDLGVPILEEMRGKKLDMLSQILPSALGLPNNAPKPGRNGNTNGNAPAGRAGY